jgi:hypothetical protein
VADANGVSLSPALSPEASARGLLASVNSQT